MRITSRIIKNQTHFAEDIMIVSLAPTISTVSEQSKIGNLEKRVALLKRQRLTLIILGITNYI